MVLQKRLDCNFNGYQFPVVPRASRSPRGRGAIKKKFDAKQKHAFEILATVAGKLLLESASSDCSNGKDLSNAIDTYGLEKENQKDINVSSSNPHQKETRHENQCPNTGINLTLGNVEKSEKASFSKKSPTLDSRDLYKSSYDGGSVSGLFGDVNKKNVESMISKTDLDQKPAGVICSESKIKVPVIKESVAGPVSRHYDELKVVNRDGDENMVGGSRRAHPDLTKRRIKNLSTSKCWEAARNMFRTDGKAKLGNHNARSCHTRQRSQRFSPSKTAYFDRSSMSKRNGRFFCESIFTSSENHSSAIGGSSSIAGGQAPSRCGDCNVKLSIKSFKVPELIIEIPANATVGSLKRSVMEAVTAALGDGLHVGVLLQGKKVRDDTKTLFQTGISRNDKQHSSLGFTLEPRQDFPSQCPPESLPSVSSHGHINEQISPILGPGTSNVSQVPASMNLDSFIKTEVNPVPPQAGISTQNIVSESQPLVAVPAIKKEALAVVPFRRKSSRPDMVQRRIRRPFSVPEVEALVRAVEELGTGRWRDVKLRAFENVKHRTYVDLKDKWKTLVHTARISPQQRRGEPVPQELLDRVLAAHAFWSEQQAKHQIKSCSLRLCL